MLFGFGQPVVVNVVPVQNAAIQTPLTFANFQVLMRVMIK